MSAEAPDQRRIFITGIGRGIGHALARSLLDRGHEVWGSTRTGEVDLPVAGCVGLDLLDTNGIPSVAAALGARLDGLDTLVNCAGVDARAFGAENDRRGPFDVDAEAITSVLAVNVTAPIVLATALLPLLELGRQPLLLNISSQLGSMEVGASAGRDAIYNASKAALNMWTLKAAAELAERGGAAVALHPGWVQSDMGGSAATLTTTESADAIAATMDSLGPDDNGRFIRWDGTDHPW